MKRVVVTKGLAVSAGVLTRPAQAVSINTELTGGKNELSI